MCTALKPDWLSASRASCGNRSLFVAVGRVRHDVAFGQCANRGAQFVVLVGQAEQIERGIDGGVHGFSLFGFGGLFSG